eukprot:1146365-Pelagomonas_calceolata.AAC.2
MARTTEGWFRMSPYEPCSLCSAERGTVQVHSEEPSERAYPALCTHTHQACWPENMIACLPMRTGPYHPKAVMMLSSQCGTSMLWSKHAGMNISIIIAPCHTQTSRCP